LAVAFVFLALARRNSELMKTFLWLLAVFEVIVAVASPLVPFRLHGDARYLTRAVVYALLLIGPVTGLAAL
jgi:hypothetical protein